MNIFVTGGSGFVGQHLIPYLIEHDHHVFALCRSYDTAYKIKQLGAQPILGDLNGIQTLADTLQNMDAVIHSAAYMDFTYHKSKYYTINVSGTQLLVDAAKKAGIKHFIYISAASVVNGESANNVDESFQPKVPGDYYSRTKLMAEKIVLAANSDTFRALAVRPPIVWGKENPHLVRMLTGKNAIPWKWIGPGTHHLSTLHIQNLIAAIGAALESDKGGEAYFVTDGETQPFKVFFTILLNAEGIITENKHISRSWAMLKAKRVEWYYKKFRRKLRPPISPAMIHLLGTQFTLNDAKARTELHYENVISMQEGLDELKEKVKKMQASTLKTEDPEESKETALSEKEINKSIKDEDETESVDDKEPGDVSVTGEQSDVEQEAEMDSSEPGGEEPEKELAPKDTKPKADVQEVPVEPDEQALVETETVETKDDQAEKAMPQESSKSDEIVKAEAEPVIENINQEPPKIETATEPEQNEVVEPEKESITKDEELEESERESLTEDNEVKEKDEKEKS